MQQDRKILVIICAISALAITFLFWLIYFKTPATTDHIWAGYLSYINACLNLMSTLCIISGILAIKERRVKSHKKWMIAAFSFSAMFLISYIIYHHFHGDSKFEGTGIIRVIYLIILVSHILLSVVALPMVLGSFTLGLMGRLDKHKKLARWTYPIWLYVSITGVVVVVMLKTFQQS